MCCSVGLDILVGLMVENPNCAVPCEAGKAPARPCGRSYTGPCLPQDTGSPGKSYALMLVKFLDYFVLPRIRTGNQDLLRRTRLSVAFHWALILLAAIYAPVFFLFGSRVSATTLLVAACVGGLSLCLLRWNGSRLTAGNLVTAAYFGALTVMTSRLGGHGAITLSWYTVAPVVALNAAGRRSAVAWSVITTTSLAAFYMLANCGYVLPTDVTPYNERLLDLVGFAGLTIFILTLALLHEVTKEQTVAELNRTQQRLLREMGFSDLAIASLPGLFYVIDSDGRLLKWNEKLEHVSGYSSEELSQIHPSGLFRGGDRKLIEERIREVFTQGHATAEACLTTKGGTAIPYLFASRRVELDGQPASIGFGVDITDLVEARQEATDYAEALAAANKALGELVDAAEVANRAKSEFLANMSHEIRTPMTAILGFTDVLLEEGRLANAPLERVTSLETIKRNGSYLLGLINDILDLSKIEADKLDVNRADCSPISVLADVESLMRVRADAKHISLEVEYVGAIPEHIRSDPTRIRQILINLVGNAIKFTETGSVRIIVRLVQSPDNGPWMQFDIVDTGIGITSEQLARLFQPFTQADASTSKKFGGTGLGLTISKRLAEILGGSISVTSTPGKGSTFTVTVETGSLEGVRMVDAPANAVLETEPDSATHAAPAANLNCRLLLAEDGPDNQRLISLILKKAGANVTLAENGQIAHDKAMAAMASGELFDVILMDMQMPVLDGYSATRMLREAGYPGPIVALTANAMAGDEEDCRQAGCDGYATKPIDRAKLFSVLTQFIGRPNTARTGSACGDAHS